MPLLHHHPEVKDCYTNQGDCHGGTQRGHTRGFFHCENLGRFQNNKDTYTLMGLYYRPRKSMWEREEQICGQITV